MKRPSWPTIILGFLNIIAAGFLMVLASRAFYARVGWTRHLQDGMDARDGLVRFGETDDTDQTAKLVEGLSEEGKRTVQQFKSRFGQRRAANTALFDPFKNSIAKLNSDEARKLANDLGPNDFSKLMKNHFVLRHPELRSEEQLVAQQKATELFRRERSNKAISHLTLEIERLRSDLTAEKDRKDLQLVENEERKKELSNLYAELEEAIAARNVADGRLKDLQDHLARTRRKYEEISKQNTTLEEQIRRLEGVAAPGGN